MRIPIKKNVKVFNLLIKLGISISEIVGKSIIEIVSDAISSFDRSIIRFLLFSIFVISPVKIPYSPPK